MKIIFHTMLSGRSPVTDFIDKQPQRDQVTIVALLEEIEENGLAAKGIRFRQIQGKLWEIKIKAPSGGYRFLYGMVSKQDLVILHGFKKKNSKDTIKRNSFGIKTIKGVFMRTKKEKTLKNYIKNKTKDDEFRLMYEEVKMHLKIAHLIEKLRIKANITQAQLAKKSSVSQPMIARLERGDQDRVPTLSTINKVFKALGYEIEVGIKKAA